jgi:hypothetical protein
MFRGPSENPLIQQILPVCTCSNIMPSWLVVLAAAASATELVVMHKDGPKECDAAHKVRRGDNITMHYIGTIVRSFFSSPFSSQHCTRCFSLLVV